MIIIQNIGKDKDNSRLYVYQVLINRDVIATFKHYREDGIVTCLRKSSKAVKEQFVDKNLRDLFKILCAEDFKIDETNKD
ncbi:MAG: hypothetical protein A3K77_00595 [Euryarchaeota archaeon RBG_13_31_8]|nr:MAG: hypothetical protein A3K77_00595 [Euryarchaeota archaeon RBG_13_31_8]